MTKDLANTASNVISKTAMGARIRDERKRQGLTLLMLARLSNVSLSTLSKAERGLIGLSYEKFLAVSRALKMDLSDLFKAPRDQNESGMDILVGRASRTVTYHAHRYEYGMLASEWINKKMTPMHGRVLSGEPRDATDFSQHEGEEFIFVIEGQLTMQFQDGRRHVLQARDSIYFKSNLGHLYLCEHGESVEILVVCVNNH